MWSGWTHSVVGKLKLVFTLNVFNLTERYPIDLYKPTEDYLGLIGKENSLSLLNFIQHYSSFRSSGLDHLSTLYNSRKKYTEYSPTISQILL